MYFFYIGLFQNIEPNLHATLNQKKYNFGQYLFILNFMLVILQNIYKKHILFTVLKKSQDIFSEYT